MALEVLPHRSCSIVARISVSEPRPEGGGFHFLSGAGIDEVPVSHAIHDGEFGDDLVVMTDHENRFPIVGSQ